jgi:putative two-component system response regulator
MGLKTLVATSIDIEELASVLDSGDDLKCRTKLSSLERSIRQRLERPSVSDDLWFPDVASALIHSQGVAALDLRCELLLLIVQWQYAQRKSFDGVHVAEQAFEFALRANALALQRKALSNLGMLHIDTKNLSDATICLVQALLIADRLGDRIGKCASLANLATARFEAGLLDEAIKLYRYVIELAGNEAVLQQIAVEAHHNIALAALILDDLASARDHMECAIKALIAPRTRFLMDQRVVMELTFTKIFVRTGDLANAKARAKISHDFALRSGSKLAFIQSQLAGVLCDAAEGNADIALTRLSSIESQVALSEPAYRDVLEIELLCNRLAGRQQYARYYSQRYLSHLAQWQRKIANQQIAALRKSMSGSGTVSRVDLTALPEEAGLRIEKSGRPTDRAPMLLDRLETLAIVAEMREDVTGEHSFRVGRLAAMLALSIGYSERDAADLEAATRLHDIGKLAIPDAILLKRSKLTTPEIEIVRRHTIEGCQILSEMRAEVESTKLCALSGPLRLAAEIALHHHEWWDGSGYPRKLVAQNIPEAARIAALADAFDELTHARPYKHEMSVEKALVKMSELSGRQFDPRLCTEFLNVARNLAMDSSTLVTNARSDDQLLPFSAANRVIERIARTSFSQTTPP